MAPILKEQNKSTIHDPQDLEMVLVIIHTYLCGMKLGLLYSVRKHFEN